MYHYNSNILPRLIAAACVVLYVVGFGALMIWGGIRVEIPREEMGMLVDFGTETESGSGEEDTTLADNYSLPEPTQIPQNEPTPTQEVEESPALEQANIETEQQAKEEEQKDVEKEPEEEEEKPREVNRKALFPGNRNNSESSSQGSTSTSEGNQGNIGGTESDEYEGSGGEGSFQPDWNLEGRMARPETFRKPKYLDERQGVVIVDIWVSGNGDVTGASFHPVGSTVSAGSPLIDEAIKAAYKVKFSQSEQDIQVGTITYKFTLNTGAK